MPVINSDKIKVKVFNREYELDTSGTEITPLEAASLAEFVSGKMEEIANESNIVDTQKLAVLTALNIADELFRLKENKKDYNEEVDVKTDRFIEMVDTALTKQD